MKKEYLCIVKSQYDNKVSSLLPSSYPFRFNNGSLFIFQIFILHLGSQTSNFPLLLHSFLKVPATLKARLYIRFLGCVYSPSIRFSFASNLCLRFVRAASEMVAFSAHVARDNSSTNNH